MGIYVWGTGCGASELLEQGFALSRVEAFVDSFPMGETFLEKPVILPQQLNISDCGLCQSHERNGCCVLLEETQPETYIGFPVTLSTNLGTCCRRGNSVNWC